MTVELLHLSDLHFGPTYRPAAGEAVLRLAAARPPDAILVSGDLTMRARAEQFEQARAFLDRLPPVPRVVVPGNHDVPLYRVWERLTDPYREYGRHIDADREPLLDLPGARIVGLDTTAPLRTIVNGRLRAAQLERCAQALAGAAPEQLRVVVMHHPLAPAPDCERDPVLRGARRVLGALERAGVDLVLGGHLHRAYIADSRDLDPAAERGLLILQCGTTTGSRGRARERGRNSLNRVRFDGRQIEITHDLLEPGGEFVPISRHVFGRSGARVRDP